MFARLSKRPWIIAIVIAVLLLAWLFSGDRFVARDDVEPDQPATTNDLARVEIQWLEAQPMQRQHVVQGQIEAWRRVELRAQVSGSVQNLDQDASAPVAVAAGRSRCLTRNDWPRASLPGCAGRPCAAATTR